MAELPNTIAMDDVESDDDDTNNNTNNNNNNNDVRGYLIRIDLKQNGKATNTFILTKETTTIGRKKSNDIILIDQTVSSSHAEIEIDSNEHEAFVIDLKSTNKTRTGKKMPSKDHQNKKAKPNRQTLIRSGDYITFGGMTRTFMLIYSEKRFVIFLCFHQSHCIFFCVTLVIHRCSFCILS